MPEVKKSEHIVAYRTCFSTGAGKWVLGDLLREAGVFDADLRTSEELAVENFVKKILRNIGLCGATESKHGWLSNSNIDSFVSKLFELPAKGI